MHCLAWTPFIPLGVHGAVEINVFFPSVTASGNSLTRYESTLCVNLTDSKHFTAANINKDPLGCGSILGDDDTFATNKNNRKDLSFLGQWGGLSNPTNIGLTIILLFASKPSFLKAIKSFSLSRGF